MKKINLTVKRFDIASNKAYFTETEGYLVDIVFKGKNIDNIAVNKTSEGKWTLTCLSTGMWFGGIYETRKEAIESITVELMDKYIACLERKDTKLAIKALTDYKQKVAQNAK